MSALTFSDLVFVPRGDMAGKQAKAFYPNGYGVSVIQGPYTYGGDAGLYELAVLRGDADDWDLTYSTPITGDVLGHLTPEAVSRVLAEVAALPDALVTA